MKPNLGDVIADKYRLDRVLGEGGMSTVYAAANVDTGKQVAIKWLQPELMGDEEQSQRLLREAQATSSIDHPNVVNVFDIGRHEGALFLVMELLHGEPLSELLQRGEQDPYEFVKLMMPVLRGVHAAHRVGVVHRDLKPDNIFICTDPHGELREPKVLDFGISKLANDALPKGQELTREGTVFGTPQYMAPEQMRDARSADARSDVYALGVIFYRAFSNEYPYDADTLTALAIRIVEGNAQPLHERCPHLQPGLCDLVMRALSLDPEQRFASVAALGQALEPFANGLLFVPGTFDRESLPYIRRDSSPGVRDTPSGLRESAVPLRDSTVPGRDSAVSLRIESAEATSRGSLPSSRPYAPPPPPPRTGAMRDNPAALRSDEANTRLIDASDLIDLPDEAPDEDLASSGSSPISGSTSTHRDSKLSIPPPPVPSSARPSRGLEVVVDDTLGTQRVGRSSRRHNWVLAASLIVIGLLAPAGWQQWQKARGVTRVSPPRTAQAPATGKTANVYAAQALRPENSAAAPTNVASGTANDVLLAGSQEASPLLPGAPSPALGAGAAPASGDAAPAPAAPAANKVRGLEAPTAPATLAPGKSANVAGRDDLDKRKRRLAAAALAPVTTQLVDDRKLEPAGASAQTTERNPYLRH
jgi:serine/threonine protein kinase